MTTSEQTISMKKYEILKNTIQLFLLNFYINAYEKERKSKFLIHLHLVVNEGVRFEF